MQWWCAAQGVPWSWRWQAYPGVWLFVLALAGAYRLLRRRFPETDRPKFRAWMFGLGVAVLWIALDWPVGALGAGYLASVHMVQYLLIALVAPPLLLMGLPRGFYEALGRGRAEPLVRVVSHPIVAIALFVAAMAWTHWPPVVDTLMVTQSGSFLLDLIWLLSGIVFWWPVVAPVPDRGWLQEPGKVAYLIVATLVNTGVFAYLTFSPLPLYATYELAPPVSGLSTRDDQLLAGLLMKMGGAVILWTAISILFFRWYRRSESEDLPRRGAVVSLLVLLMAAGCADGGSPADSPVWIEAGPLEVATPVVGEPPTSDRAALYMRIRNPGDSLVQVTRVEVPGARAELHRTSLEDGIMRMERVETLALAPGGEIVLRPGDLHVMLLDLMRPLRAGDAVTVRIFMGGSRDPAEILAEVVPLEAVEERLEGRL